MSVNQRTKEEITHLCSFKDSSIFTVMYYLVLDNFITFMYISFLLKGTGKYDIYYNGLMWRLF